MKRIIVAALSATLLLSLVACTKTQSAPVPAEATAEVSRVITAPDKAASISFEGNATTGYSWQAAEYDDIALNVVDDGYVQNESDPEMVAVGGVYHFYVQAKDGATAGTYTVVFSYAQAWDGGEKGQTATVKASVDKDGVVTLSEPVFSEE